MNVIEMPSTGRIALAWLRCGWSGVPHALPVTARVTVLTAMKTVGLAPYLRRTPNPGSAVDIGSTSSGTNFASFSASSYST